MEQPDSRRDRENNLEDYEGNTNTRRQREEIERAFPEALVTGFEIFEGKLGLPDPDDNHVLAAAIETAAAVIVTDNLGHFPAALLEPHSIEACSADDFIADAVDLHPFEAIAALRRMRERFNNPALDVDALIHKTGAQELTQVATIMDTHRTFL